MSRIHHSIIKAVTAAGSSIEEVTSQPYAFVLINEALALRATGDDARELRQLAQDWVRGENIDGYGLEDQTPKSASVIKPSYRNAYKAHGGGCGDWLQQTLNSLTKNPHGDFDEAAFTAILSLNGIIDFDKYKSHGLMRMSCGNRLRKIVKTNGVLYTPDGEMTPPK